MALVVKDRVQETSTTTGTGTFTLAGAVSGFQSFSVIGNANTTYYAIVGGTEWEVGLGTYTSSGTLLSRDTILESSNGGTAVNFSAGTKNVFVTYPAEKGLYLDASGNAIALGTPASATLTNATGLPISTGVSGLGTGVATFLATPSSANLRTAITDETGTGAAVFATSPTLVTPVLGTPSSGTLSSCTGLPLTTGVTGTLPVANGGTNLTTYTTGDIVYASATNTLNKLADVATGNALISGGVGVAPSYGKIGLTTHVSGTLPVANGGTGITSLGTGVATFLGTPSSANLATAITDETGSGALVFGTSPTIASPTFTSQATFAAGTATAPAFTTTGDTNTGIFFSAADTIDFAEGGAACGQFDSSANFKFNSGYGSVATAYGCRAWVNFNGTGTVAIRASGNVTSITDHGAGEYTVNFTNAMPNVNYSFTACVTRTSGQALTVLMNNESTVPATGSLRLLCVSQTASAGTATDSTNVCIAIFR
jgi:hypothetical protein